MPNPEIAQRGQRGGRVVEWEVRTQIETQDHRRIDIGEPDIAAEDLVVLECERL